MKKKISVDSDTLTIDTLYWYKILRKNSQRLPLFSVHVTHGSTSLFKVMLQPLISALTEQQCVWLRHQMNSKHAELKAGVALNLTDRMTTKGLLLWKQMKNGCAAVDIVQQLRGCDSHFAAIANLRKIKLTMFLYSLGNMIYNSVFLLFIERCFHSKHSIFKSFTFTFIVS